MLGSNLVAEKMARDSTLSIGVLNIAMHAPHTARHYIDLFIQAYRNQIQAKGRGDQYVLIGALDFVEKGHPERGLTGELYRYSQLDSKEPWFNINNREEASEDERKQIRIPDYLKPHFSRFPFVFFPKGHRLYIEFRKYGKVTNSTSRRDRLPTFI